MIIWLDAQISPSIATWIQDHFSINAIPIRDLDLLQADDYTVFNAAKVNKAVILTKDKDFLYFQQQLGAPPSIIWLTCGNTSNNRLKGILEKSLSNAIQLIESGDVFIEIGIDQP